MEGPKLNFVITEGAAAVVEVAEVVKLVRRHLQGDWGDLDAHDQGVNRRSQAEGGRVFSRYTLASGTVVYLITEGATTTIMLSGEY